MKKKFLVCIVIFISFCTLFTMLNNVQAVNETSTSSTSSGNSNAKLSNLGIEKYDFKGFKPDILEYETTIPNDVTEVKVYATTQENGATFTVSGNKDLKVGKNKVTILVTAADKKTTKNYYINVTRESETSLNKVNTSKDLRLISISVDDEKNKLKLEPSFKSDVYEYTINVEGELEKIPLKVVPNQQDATEEITGNENLKDGENLITIKVTSSNKKETLTYKINVRKNIKEEEPVVESNDRGKYYSSPHVQYGWYIIGGVLSFFVIVSIIIIVVNKKKKQRYANKRSR